MLKGVRISTHLTNADERVGDGGANVGTHDDWHGRLHVQDWHTTARKVNYYSFHVCGKDYQALVIRTMKYLKGHKFKWLKL